MATRRVPKPQGSDDLTAPDSSLSPSHPTPSRPATNFNIVPAVPAHIIYKLLFFTFLMFAAPISLYFATLNNVFGGNSTYAGILAAATANVVLIGYIVVAVMEDQGDQAEGKKEK